MMAPSEPSLDAVLPHEERVACEHADRCGGCPLIGLTYAEQLALKRGRLVQSLSRYSSMELVYPESVAAADPIVGYRTRAKLIVAPGGRVGLFAKGGGHDVVDIPSCRVLATPIARVAAQMRVRIALAEASGGPLAPYDPSGHGWLRAIDLREVRVREAGRVLVTFVVDRARASDLATLRSCAEELIQGVPEVIGVAASLHDGKGPQVLGGETVSLAGATSAPDRVGPSSQIATFG